MDLVDAEGHRDRRPPHHAGRHEALDREARPGGALGARRPLAQDRRGGREAVAARHGAHGRRARRLREARRRCSRGLDVVLVPWEESANTGIGEALRARRGDAARRASRSSSVPRAAWRPPRSTRWWRAAPCPSRSGPTILRTETAAHRRASRSRATSSAGLGGARTVSARRPRASRSARSAARSTRSRASAIAAELLGRRLRGRRAEEDADVVVVNTCTVTGEADRKARKEVRRALALPRRARRRRDRLPRGARRRRRCARSTPRVVVEADKARVAARVADAARRGRAADAAPARRRPARSRRGTRTRAQVKVEDGCDAYCAYCIVPYARGLPARGPARRDVVARGRGARRRRGRRRSCSPASTSAGTATTAARTSPTSCARSPRPASRASGCRASSRCDLPGRLLEALAATPAVVPAPARAAAVGVPTASCARWTAATTRRAYAARPRARRARPSPASRSAPT